VIADGLVVEEGPALLAGLEDGRGLAAHRLRHGRTRRPTADTLLGMAEEISLRGRGGAAFPFAAKLLAVLAGRRRPVVVVNLSEGEPLSAKDHALAVVRPHLVLDGAAAAAHAVGSRVVDLALPGERPGARSAMLAALAEREDADRFRCHVAEPRFVAGQGQAVVELVSGRPGLPVTSVRPAAVSGVDGRPTLLSNAETFAHLGLALSIGAAAYRRLGTAEEPGTTLLTVTVPGLAHQVREARFGARLGEVVPELQEPGVGHVLVGGFHGCWVDASLLSTTALSVPGLRAAGAPLGAGVLHVPAECPVSLTAAIVSALAEGAAGRCGPCRLGLPRLAGAVGDLAAGRSGPGEVARLAGVVDGRGACAHPDGTARLVRSLLAALPAEVALHGRGGCSHGEPGSTRAGRERAS
jgi:NADH:ubiquinone oxidoreductase subunit F (NADH-binding)